MPEFPVRILRQPGTDGPKRTPEQVMVERRLAGRENKPIRPHHRHPAPGRLRSKRLRSTRYRFPGPFGQGFVPTDPVSELFERRRNVCSIQQRTLELHISLGRFA